MTATIWKFPLPIDDVFEISMPRDAELLHVGTQNDAGYLWARVVPARLPESRLFCLRGTGHSIGIDCRYVGSFMLHNGALVFHLFERDRER